ncbi:hypothetical protein EJ02DRAFT_413703 [Clathrospora elynae]|uniref:Uncharacterized protein n=1 Tax=Clathrospora elynae TaxID=706981 RepID=A0A6A5S9M7_9PLEO|nr:hypothetical protein EJ02DRAFT_413703 [Clathrospora elynae]
MNTVKSVYYGWATLIVAGGGAYVFAKRGINADRAAKAEIDRQKRIRLYELEHGLSTSPSTTTPLNPVAKPGGGRGDGGRDEGGGSPSGEAYQDPAPTRHAPENERQAVGEKSKYEASDAYRSRKGDRFS